VTDGIRLTGTDRGWTAHFGVRITAAVDLSLLVGYAELPTAARCERARGEDVGYLARLCAADQSCVFEVRWDIGVDGPVAMVLGRLRRPDRAAAELAAAHALARLAEVPEHVRAEPVDAAPLPIPPEPGGVAELRRQCWVAEPRRLDAGARFYLAVPPFRSAPGAWPALLDGLPPLTITTTLRPTWVPPEFSTMLGTIAAQYDRLATPAEFRPGGLYSGPVHLDADPFALTAAPLFRDAAARYRGWVFQLRVTVTSPRWLDDAVLGRLAHTLGGVFERPADPVQHRLFVDGLTSFDPPRWGGHPVWGSPAVPESLRLLTELADPFEAAQAAWLPAAAGGAVPGVPTVAPAADRRAGHGGVRIDNSTVTVGGHLVGGDNLDGGLR
jgi:hypothetical protein